MPLPERQLLATETTWAANPQFRLVVSQPADEKGYDGRGGMELPVRVRLAQADARGLGAKFPFAERLQEIFLCVLRLDFPESRRLHRFDKKRVVRSGGVSKPRTPATMF